MPTTKPAPTLLEGQAGDQHLGERVGQGEHNRRESPSTPSRQLNTIAGPKRSMRAPTMIRAGIVSATFAIRRILTCSLVSQVGRHPSHRRRQRCQVEPDVERHEEGDPREVEHPYAFLAEVEESRGSLVSVRVCTTAGVCICRHTRSKTLFTLGGTNRSVTRRSLSFKQATSSMWENRAERPHRP